MKIITIIFFAFTCFYSCGQNNQPKIDMNKVNESIKTLSIESELGNKIIKDELFKHSDSLKTEVQKLSKIVEEFNQFVNQMTEEFITKAGGIDSNGRPTFYKDKNVTNEFFIVGGKGKELKSKIEKTRAQIMIFISKDHVEELSKSIPLTVNDIYSTQSNKEWEELKFRNMPVAAILPMLTSCISDANTSERIILDYWRIKFR